MSEHEKLVEEMARAIEPGAFRGIENHVWTCGKIHAVGKAEAALSVVEAAIRADEREACAKIAGDWWHWSSIDRQAARDIAAAIRAREPAAET